jgi:hypothetical protein
MIPMAMWRDTKLVLSYKWFIQKKCIDFKETFSLVYLKDSFRTKMTLAAYFNLELYQMDVKTLFLNGNIDETLYGATRKLCFKRFKGYG